MNEVWKDIIGYEGFYQVSNIGRVRSLDRDMIDKNGIGYSLKGSIRKISCTGKGYQNIGLSKDGEQKTFFIHRLVAESFIPNPKNLPIVNHIDGDTHNNHVSNLEWVTQSENINHAIKIGNKEPKEVKENPKKPTTNKQKIFDVLNRFPDMKTGKVAELVGCNPRYVTKIRVIWNKV